MSDPNPNPEPDLAFHSGSAKANSCGSGSTLLDKNIPFVWKWRLYFHSSYLCIGSSTLFI